MNAEKGQFKAGTPWMLLWEGPGFRVVNGGVKDQLFRLEFQNSFLRLEGHYRCKTRYRLGSPPEPVIIIAANIHRELFTGSLESPLVRASLAEFELPGVEGPHQCFVFEPLTINLVATRASVPVDEVLFKTVAFYVFRALEFLHTKAQMVHCDLRASNFCLKALDESTFRNLELLESVRPSPRKTYSDRTIYDGVGQIIPEHNHLLGIPVLCDFGEARFGQEYYKVGIQPFMYQAPEAVFNIPWSYPADIWNAGVMLWHLFEEKRLFSAVYDGKPSYPRLVAEMIALMGKPPAEFVLRSPFKVRREWVNDAGEWCCEHPDVKVPCLKLEDEERVLKDANVDNTPFLKFMKRILVWEPEKRPTASELLADPWLASIIPSSKLL